MRVLHTSDWHLGVSTGPASRTQEQEWFLAWLLEALDEQQVDVLLVAGDVFDSMHPSAEAQALYFRFLARVPATGVRDVVIVGGNHDSATRLDAPRALLQQVNVHVIGGVPPEGGREQRLVVPLRRRGQDDPAAVCLAVPYVHEYRLGVRTTDLDRAATRAAFRTAFADLYRGLADDAAARFPGLPLLATGHLTLGLGARREDYPQEIHQVGTIEGLPTDILDPRIDYTALGHIHRGYPIEGGAAWYSGTPVALSLTEAASPRRVLRVDVEAGQPPVVQPIEVPIARDLVALTGAPDDVLEQLSALSWTTRLPPLVHVRVQTELPEPGLVRRLHEALPGDDDRRPVLVEVQQRAPEQEQPTTVATTHSLDELRPGQVFDLLCDARQLSDELREPLQSAFSTVASIDEATLQEMIDAIELPPSAARGAK